MSIHYRKKAFVLDGNYIIFHSTKSCHFKQSMIKRISYSLKEVIFISAKDDGSFLTSKLHSLKAAHLIF